MKKATKKLPMNHHAMSMSLDKIAIERGGVDFEIHRMVNKNEPGSPQDKIGTISVSNGSLTWHSKNLSKCNEYSIDWDTFDKVMININAILEALKDGTIQGAK